ncbi:ubiquinol-cytochrome c reductase iron-sulfur subunit [Hyphobacterium sp. HN65]|uniref:Ubiquinol-cytochrome c reductase iron-sulfur subunit n=1 Tax=Hyphobacterium lacteum TaxID=3116575 RepID=A0ABU7LS37_9PROT|nr:ubiquinol-cytochrome c reductase iron-sulfur subunit [Hyphobacterium sp. HN65]MEE2526456.1 ubiquinol-cytochrome c reductase iron-sulfur subunit [Hyphobacterium sp. HN65]
MTDHTTEEPTRRDFIYIAAGGAAVIGGAMTLWPFIDQMNPAADTLALGSIRVDISPIAVGQEITVMFRGGPVFIRRRTETEIAEAREGDTARLIDDLARNENLPEDASAADANRVLNPEYLIVKGNCTHLGCVPLGNGAGDYDGWFCPCHGSHYDSSARIRRGPAPENLPVPAYAFENDGAVVKLGATADEVAAAGWSVA